MLQIDSDEQPHIIERLSIPEQVRYLQRELHAIESQAERPGTRMLPGVIDNVLGHLFLADAYLANPESEGIFVRGARELNDIAGEVMMRFDGGLSVPLTSHGRTKRGATAEALRLVRVGRSLPDISEAESPDMYGLLGRIALSRDNETGIIGARPVPGEYSLGGRRIMSSEDVAEWLITTPSQPRKRITSIGHGYYDAHEERGAILASAVHEGRRLDEALEVGEHEWGDQLGRISTEALLRGFDPNHPELTYETFASMWSHVEDLPNRPEAIVSYVKAMGDILRMRGFLEEKKKSP